MISLQDQECGDLILTTAKSSIYSTTPRGIKRITKYTLGFKSFETAEATIAGIELHRMLKKGQMENVGDPPSLEAILFVSGLTTSWVRPHSAL